jgi:cytochrome c oxidase assembly protein subunit 15
MVTSKNVGLAVPDWPTTFGYNMFLFPVSKWVGGILFEHTHRLLASGVGFLTLLIALWFWIPQTYGRTRWLGAIAMVLGTAILGIRKQPIHVALGIGAILVIAGGIYAYIKSDFATRWLGVIALAGVILQGILGGLRVTMMKDEIGILHACLAQAFLGLLIVIALVTTNFWQGMNCRASAAADTSPRVVGLAMAITIAIYVQLALGATMRHQHRDLSILDFPTANGAWIPDTSADALTKINAWRDARGLSDVTAFQIWLQMAHRFLALIIAIAVIAFALRAWRNAGQLPALKRLAILWVALIICQITLGAWTIWSNKAADVATAHVALGAIMLSFGVSISAICWRISQGEVGRARPPGAPHSEPVPA